MSTTEKLQKKYNQAARREIRYELAKQKRFWEKAMKPKPKYMPEFIWKYMQRKVINPGFFEDYRIGQ